jgi:hypothetical protein
MFAVLFFKSYLNNQLIFSVKRSGRRPAVGARRPTPDALFLGDVKALVFFYLLATIYRLLLCNLFSLFGIR